jgi:hypothetical protein
LSRNSVIHYIHYMFSVLLRHSFKNFIFHF